jgi:hypothetical protein
MILQSNIFFGLLAVAGLATKLFLGFVLSRGLITKYVLTEKSDAKEKTQSVYNTLLMVQVPFGILAIILGVIGVIFNIIY